MITETTFTIIFFIYAFFIGKFMLDYLNGYINGKTCWICSGLLVASLIFCLIAAHNFIKVVL